MRSRPSAALVAVVAVAGCGGGEGPGPARSAAAPPGLQVWAANGCGSCHTLKAANARGEIGPNLDASLTGWSRARVIDAIVNPPSSMMPQDFGTRLTQPQLRALADLLTQE